MLFMSKRQTTIDFVCFLHSQEEALHETGVLLEDEDPKAEVKLKSTLEELASGCLKYVAIAKNSSSGAGSGKTKLDKERMKLCQREMVCAERKSCFVNLLALLTTSPRQTLNSIFSVIFSFLF